METVQPTAERASTVTHVASLDTLVGAHPDALSDIFARGTPATVEALGERPHGRLLSLVQTGPFHLLVRPLLQIISTTLMPWEGVVFDHGGNGGANVIRKAERVRFRAERGPSAIDGAPALVLTYPAHPWLRDELRMIDDGVAVGITFVTVMKKQTPAVWFGLQR